MDGAGALFFILSVTTPPPPVEPPPPPPPMVFIPPPIAPIVICYVDKRLGHLVVCFDANGERVLIV